MPDRTDAELKQLAHDIHSGLVFTNRHIRVPTDASEEVQQASLGQDMRMIFMPLALAEQGWLDELQARQPALFFEYVSKAGPRSFNGYPIFMSFQVVNQAEWAKLERYLDALKAQPDPLADL